MKYLKLYETLTERTVQDYLDERNLSNDVTKLFCDNNQITSLEGVESLQSLQTLYGQYNKLTSLKGVETLTNLKELYCNDNKLTSLKGVETLTNIQILYCHYNKLSSLEGIEKLTNLQKLLCYGNQLTSLKGIEKLTNLEFLTCYSNPLLIPLDYKIAKRIYNLKQNTNFGTYEYQKEFIEEKQEKVEDLIKIGFDDEIKEEYKDLLDFFNIK